MLRPVLEGLLDLLAPPRCPACDAVVPPGEARFCDACGPLLDRWPHGDDAGFVYGGPLAEAIKRFKYGRRWDLARPLGALLLQPSLSFVDRADLVVPVPLHPRRLRARGFNQATLLARYVAKTLAIPLETSLLERVRETNEQASLSKEARVVNVRGAFRAKRAVTERVLLIDDVRTSGATLAECAAALTARGAAGVCSLVLARAEV
ncbi:MAG: ComF family protein [Sandaracinaceae bacterium]|nr:ComF family protein [Sandaracinaceae bacterium]